MIFVNAPIAVRRDSEAGAVRVPARWQLYIFAPMLSACRVAAETFRRYAIERVAFGKPTGHHQALAFLIADMRSAVNGARLPVSEQVSEQTWYWDSGVAVSAPKPGLGKDAITLLKSSFAM